MDWAKSEDGCFTSLVDADWSRRMAYEFPISRSVTVNSDSGPRVGAPQVCHYGCSRVA